MALLAAELSTVVAAAEAGSFSRAARRLGAEQSTVSRRIRAVEDRLGVLLFERGAAGARPTPAGQRLVAEATRCGRALEAAAYGEGDGPRPFRLGAVWGFAGAPAARMVQAVQAHRPARTARLREGGAAELLDLLLGRQLDLALIVDPGDLEGGLAGRPLWWEQMHLVRPAAGPCSAAAQWRDLDGRTLLCRTVDAAELAREAASSGGASIRLEIHDCTLASLLALVAAGAGWLLVPQSQAAQLPEGVQACPLQGLRRRIWGVFRKDAEDGLLAELLQLALQEVSAQPQSP